MAGVQRYGFVLWPGFGLGGLAAALDTLHAANHLLASGQGGPAYEPLLLAAPVPSSVGAGTVASWAPAAGGAQLATRPLAAAGTLDGLFLLAAQPPGPADQPALHTLAAVWRNVLAQGGVVGGLEAGAAWLAEAGLLQGHRATVHWPWIESLAERHPQVMVSQQVFEIDRQRLSGAGQWAARDLFITWLGLRHGERLAQELAARLGLAELPARDARQSLPLGARIAAQGSGGSTRLAEALALMEANLSEPLPTEEIARLVGVSRRQLERLFKQHLDALPSRWYLQLRLARARRMLRQSSQSVLQIALGCGFASGPHFSNAYRTHFGHTPREERSPRATQWPAAAGAAAEPGQTTEPAA